MSSTVHSCKLDYVNPDPLLQLVGPLNITPVILEGKPIPALLDSGSQISSCTEELAHHLQLDIQPLTGLALHGVRSSSIPYVSYVEAHLQLPDPVNWEGNIVLLVLPHDDMSCILSTRVLQQVQAEVPMERWQASPQWNHAMTATLLGDVLSSELDSASSGVVLCAKVTLKPGSAVTLHGQLQRHEPHKKWINVITEPMYSSELPVGVTVMAMKGILSPGSTRILVCVYNNPTRSVSLPKHTVIAQCQAANVVPAPTVQMELADDQTATDDGYWKNLTYQELIFGLNNNNNKQEIF